MGLREWFMNRIIARMSHAMIAKMMDRFLAGLSSEERRGLMEQMMPHMTAKMIEGMSDEETQTVIGSMVPTVMAQMLSGQGEMSSIMKQMTKNLMTSTKGQKEEGQGTSNIKTEKELKPWESCPYRNLCQEGFKERL